MSSKQSKSSDVNSGAADDQEEFGLEIRDAPPADLLLEIQSFSGQGIQKHESSAIVVGNYKWRLTVYPNGREDKDEEDENISVFLSVADTDSLPPRWEVNAKCNILLHNQISDTYVCFRGRVRRFDAKNPIWGISISKKTLTEDCNGYVVDDKCLFGAEVFICKRRHTVECLSFHDWKISDFSQLERIWYSEVFTAGDFRWRMKLYPNGYKAGKDKSVSIYLECVDAKRNKSFEEVKADFTIRVNNKLLPHRHLCRSLSHLFTSEDPDCGHEYFVPIRYMRDPNKGFVVDDCCFIEFQISVFTDAFDD